jgi:hypothetical protein
MIPHSRIYFIVHMRVKAHAEPFGSTGTAFELPRRVPEVDDAGATWARDRVPTPAGLLHGDRGPSGMALDDDGGAYKPGRPGSVVPDRFGV